MCNPRNNNLKHYKTQFAYIHIFEEKLGLHLRSYFIYTSHSWQIVVFMKKDELIKLEPIELLELVTVCLRHTQVNCQAFLCYPDLFN